MSIFKDKKVILQGKGKAPKLVEVKPAPSASPKKEKEKVDLAKVQAAEKAAAEKAAAEKAPVKTQAKKNG